MWVAVVFAKGFNNERAKFESNAEDAIELTDQVSTYLAETGEFMKLESHPSETNWEFSTHTITDRKQTGGVSVDWIGYA